MKNTFEKQLKTYNDMPKNDRFWIGGLYNLTQAGIENYQPLKFKPSMLFELVGTTGDLELHFDLVSEGKMFEFKVNEKELYSYFEFCVAATRKVYDKDW